MWRNAKSIAKLRKQMDERFPNRSIAADGTIGDAAHQSRSSDHNPWIRLRGENVVSAIDITHDPAHGVDCHVLAQQLIASRDRRIKYIIWNRRIIAGRDGPQPWMWRNHGGAPHTHHMHLSVEDTEERFDDDRDWVFALGPTTYEASRPPTKAEPLLKAGHTGLDVKRLQEALNESGAKLLVDGDFGPATDRAVRMFQRANGIVADGVVGVYTWEKLNAIKEKA